MRLPASLNLRAALEATFPANQSVSSIGFESPAIPKKSLVRISRIGFFSDSVFYNLHINLLFNIRPNHFALNFITTCVFHRLGILHYGMVLIPIE